jgi:hypothetical protein
MPTTHDAHRLMAEAAKPGVSLAESTRLVNEAQAILAAHRRTASLEREVDLSNAVIQDHLVPVRVHEHHTASTDWLGEIDTGQDLRAAEHDILATATLWYGKTASLVKENPDEFAEQAKGVARKMAGAFGERADAAEDLFLSHVTAMHDREVKAGTITVEADTSVKMPEAGGGTFDVFPTGNYEQALPGEATTSERAPAIQELGGAPSSGASDVTAENDPGLGVTNSTADADNGDANTRRSASRKEATPMPHAQCPTCGGHGRVAVRLAPKQAASGLEQIQEIADAKDNPAQTPLPPQVAFPWVMNPADIQAAISQTEQQIQERNAKSPLISGTASRAEAAQKAAEATYRRVMAGQDDSGWAGDMGAQGWQPGQQDGGNAPSSNLGEPDPVYGYGGDQPDRPVKPYGAMEADDYTNNPGQNWQPGQPTQMDMGGRQMSTDAPNTYQTGPNAGQKAASADPEIAKAQAFIAQRTAWLQGRGN